MLDRLDRPLQDLRISLTDRCNLRCRYCMPREAFGASHLFLPRAQLLSFEEIERVVRAFVRLGVSKLRLTGGEPLLRRDVELLVAMLSRIEGVSEIAMTTNGLLLERHARALARAGLTRVTVSLDALDDEVLRAMADAPVSAARVLDGIEAAVQAGLKPVKVNMVVRRGVNDHCVLDMASHFRGRDATVRFIEYMDVGESNGWRPRDVVSAAEIVERIAARWPLQPLAPAHPGEVASRYRYRDGGGEIGVIHSVSAPFCGGCTRARLSADGKLFTCLFARRGHDLRALLRTGASDAELQAKVRGIWERRTDRYSAERAQVAADTEVEMEPKIEMSYIGG